MKFSICAEKNDIKLIVAELENALKNPNLYYGVAFQEAFAEMIPDILEIYNELKAHL